MREKIAEIIGELRCWEGTNYDTPLEVADAILSLLVESCDCTFGELPERARKMRELILHLQKFITEEIPIKGDYMLYEMIKKLNKQIDDTIKEVKDV